MLGITCVRLASHPGGGGRGRNTPSTLCYRNWNWAPAVIVHWGVKSFPLHPLSCPLSDSLTIWEQKLRFRSNSVRESCGLKMLLVLSLFAECFPWGTLVFFPVFEEIWRDFQITLRMKNPYENDDSLCGFLDSSDSIFSQRTCRKCFSILCAIFNWK